MKSSTVFLAVLVCLGASTIAHAQSSPVYGENVVSRTTHAVKYEHRSGSTKIDFHGTDLMPSVTGEAKVESKRGAMAIEVEFNGLSRANYVWNRVSYLRHVGDLPGGALRKFGRSAGRQ